MRLHFTIRDLLWLVALIALAVGWWLDHRALTQRDERVLEVYPLKVVDQKQVLPLVQSVIAGDAGLRAVVDPKAGTLIVLARPSQHVIIRKLIEKLATADEPGSSSAPRSGKLALEALIKLNAERAKILEDQPK